MTNDTPPDQSPTSPATPSNNLTLAELNLLLTAAQKEVNDAKSAILSAQQPFRGCDDLTAPFGPPILKRRRTALHAALRHMREIEALIRNAGNTTG